MEPRTLPETYPLPAPSLADAKRMQFRLLERVCAHFSGEELLTSDLGVTPELGRPETTKRVEDVLSDFFGVQGCALVQGAGTGAIRAMLDAAISAGGEILVHDAPPYSTTRHTFLSKGLRPVNCDFNDPASVRDAAASGTPSVALVQHSRQRPEDSHALEDVVGVLAEAGLVVLTDENYTALKVPRIGVEAGAAASAFSMFKLLGPEGVGCVVGSSEIIDRIRRANYSGGGQVQGHQALDSLRALVSAPVQWAIQSEVVDEVVGRLREGEVEGVQDARVANGQDRMIMVLFEESVARKVVRLSARFGAQNYPVGANSRYEISPLFYRLSGSFLEARGELADYAIRINPLRAGADLVLSILTESLRVVECS